MFARRSAQDYEKGDVMAQRETREHVQPTATLSVISHGQFELAGQMLASLGEHAPSFPLEILLTRNLPSADTIPTTGLPFEVREIHNRRPLGYAANHNQAFAEARGSYFGVLNPDLVFKQDVFTPLVRLLESDQASIVAPVLIDSQDVPQDSFRDLPSPVELARRMLFPMRPVRLPAGDSLIRPDWIAGMFLFMSSEFFRRLGGFDPKFHLYFEDVDFCCRARLAGYRLAIDPSLRVVHLGQRRSHRDPRHLLWHALSAFNFFTSRTYRDARRLRRKLS
jgi:N-acetylglucosaminyl-diphospho-decaprenol L-rhamnosyltransferase